MSNPFTPTAARPRGIDHRPVPVEAGMHAVRAGQLAPAFRLKGADGEPVALIDLVAKGPLVISFYRGLWCDFCASALARLAKIDPDIRALGASQVAIGPVPSTGEGASLANAGFPVLADPGLQIAGAYGLTTLVPEQDRGHYLASGFTPAGQEPWRIAVPATYIVDRHGRVAMAAIDVDYRNRLDAGAILSTLSALQGRA